MEYVEHGRADGVPAIFLHGVTDSWRSFERVLPLLPPSIHAFAISQRGHGDSSRPTSGYRFADMSSDLLAFLDAMGLRTAIIVGHSMGGCLAQWFVIHHPDRVERFVLMGAFSTFDDPGFADFVASSIAPLTDPIAAPFAREWQLSTLARAIPAHYLDAVVSETLKVPARVWREAFDGFLKTADFTSELTKVSVPVLLDVGRWRQVTALRAAQDRLLEVMPNARFIAYQGFRHAFHWEDPGAVHQRPRAIPDLTDGRSLRGEYAYEFVLMVGDNMYGSDNPRDFERKFELPSSRFVQYFVIGNSAKLRQGDLENGRMTAKGFDNCNTASCSPNWTAISSTSRSSAIRERALMQALCFEMPNGTRLATRRRRPTPCRSRCRRPSSH